jgi:hypothetical protein
MEGFVWDDFIASRPEGRPFLTYMSNGTVKVDAHDGGGPVSMLEDIPISIAFKVLNSAAVSI